jgi:hypothetical protein
LWGYFPNFGSIRTNQYREMKQLLLSIGFLLFSFSISIAQSWPPVAGETSSPCAGVSTQSTVQGGGAGAGAAALVQWPMNKVVMILREARPFFSGMNLGQMIQAYHNCGCVITYLGEGYFRVVIGGTAIVIAISDL